jgi:CheY-like chemotaxis protein
VEDGVERPAGPGRRSSFRVGLAGGSQPQRAAVRDEIIQVREVDTEIVDLGDAPEASEIDPKIGLLALLLDQTNQTAWSAALRPAASNGRTPLTVALVAERSSQVIQSALRAGADDVLTLPPSYEDLLRVLLRASEARRRVDAPDQNKVCSLVSISGGRGTSSSAQV